VSSSTLSDHSKLRLRDRIAPGARVLFVGINPGVRSAQTGHHFAGYSNRFWKLLFESGLVPEPITYEDDDRLPAFGYGITNIVPRPSPGMSDLRPAEYLDGARVLMAKIRKYQPAIVALVGVTVYRALMVSLGDKDALKRAVTLGIQKPTVPFPARVFVLPNPSGRNANYSYEEMLAAFRQLRRALRPTSAEARLRSRTNRYPS
jgi:double-stranded uracil-DNA glycosylase